MKLGKITAWYLIAVLCLGISFGIQLGDRFPDIGGMLTIGFGLLAVLLLVLHGGQVGREAQIEIEEEEL